MRKLCFYFILLLVVFTNAQAEDVFESCRIKGYAHEVDCVLLGGVNSSQSMMVFRRTSTVRYPIPEPVIWIPNGLAFNSNDAASRVMRQLYRVLTNRDFYWLGLGDPKQNPNLMCSEETSRPARLSIAERIDPLNNADLLYQCQKHLLDSGVNQYSAEYIAQHYEAVRKQLGLAQVIVYAEGSGAAVANVWQQIAPQNIKFQVFDSPIFAGENEDFGFRLGIDEILEELSIRCASNADCQRQYPIDQQKVDKIIERLPAKIKIIDPLYGNETSLEMSSSLFYTGLAQILSSPFLTARLPKVLSHAANDDWQPFLGLLSLSWSKNVTVPNTAASLAQYCLTRFDSKLLNLHGDGWFKIRQQLFNQRCGALKKQIKETLKPAASNSNPVPTLLLSGGQRLIRGQDDRFLTNATRLHIQNIGSNVLNYGCAKDVVYRYFNLMQKSTSLTVNIDKLDADCLQKIPLPMMDTF